MKLDLTRGGPRWSGTLSVATWGGASWPLTEIRLGGRRVRFVISDGDGRFVFNGLVDADGKIRGTYTVGTWSCPFWLGRERLEAADHPRRPQTPRPPFPYNEQDVTYRGGVVPPGKRSAADNAERVKLAGTLTLPRGAGPFPAVLLLSGSGPHDRDCRGGGHEMFRVIADHLARAGIASLRVDDRGVGHSTGRLGEATLDELAEDALAAVRFLQDQDRIDPARVGLLGHSEGGTVAPLAVQRYARDGKPAAFVIILGGTGLPGDQVLLLQRRTRRTARGDSPAQIEADLDLDARVIDLVKRGLDAKAVRARILRQESPMLAAVESGRGTRLDTPQFDAYVASLSSPAMRAFLAYDPAPALRSLDVPVLVLHGELDLNVPAEPNLDAMELALRGAGNSDVTVHRLDRINHYFQSVRTGLEEYDETEQTIDPEVLSLMSEWVSSRFGRSATR